MHVVGAARAVSLAMLIISVIWVFLGFIDALDIRISLTYGLISAVLFAMAFYGSHTSRRGFLIPIMLGIVVFCVLLIILFVLKIVGVQEARNHGFGYRRNTNNNRYHGGGGGDWNRFGGGGGGGGQNWDNNYNGGGGGNWMGGGVAHHGNNYDGYGSSRYSNGDYYYDDRSTFDVFIDFFSIAIGIFLLIWFMHVFVRAYRYLGLYIRAGQKTTTEQREVATNTGILRQKHNVADV